MMPLLVLNQLCYLRIPSMRFGGLPPLPNLPMDHPLGLSPPRNKDKVVFVLGATGTGKSKLAIGLAVHFGGEVVNSDKMQVYDGLDVITNKVTDEEMSGIPHHLIGGIHPDADFTADEFRQEAMRAVESILRRGRVPVVAGGSNSYIEALVDGEGFRERYECCFVWVKVDLPVLHQFVAERVDKMVEQGLVEEARGVFDPEADYGRGVRRSIGVPEMDRYLRAEAEGVANEETKARLLAEAIDEVKLKTCKLTCTQLGKIHRLCTLPGWDVHRVDATEVFLRRGTPEADETWVKVVMQPSIEIVQRFLGEIKDADQAPAGDEKAFAAQNGVASPAEVDGQTSDGEGSAANGVSCAATAPTVPIPFGVDVETDAKKTAAGLNVEADGIAVAASAADEPMPAVGAAA